MEVGLAVFCQGVCALSKGGTSTKGGSSLSARRCGGAVLPPVCGNFT